MSTVMLLIAHEDDEHLSFHDNDGAALEELIRYVDNRWAAANLAKDAAYPEPARRIDAWLNATEAFYLIAEASIDKL